MNNTIHIAYLILAHENPVQYHLLVDQLLKDTDAAVFVHVDKRSSLKDFQHDSERVTILNRRIDIKWGGISMVNATLELLKTARKGNYDYYCLLSGRDHPLRSPLDFNKYLRSIYPKGLLDGASVVERWTERGLDRVKYFFIYRFKNRKVEIWQSRVVRKWGRRLGINRKFFSDMYPCCGSQWWTLSLPLVDYVFDYLQLHPKYFNFYAWAGMPDEQFFHTLLINKKQKLLVNQSQTLVVWEDGFPHTFTLSEVGILQCDKEHFFFRKYSDQDSLFFEYLKGLSNENKYISMDSEQSNPASSLLC